jgi:hypothetical protein
MLLHCSHCDMDQPDTDQTCLRCGMALNIQTTDLSLPNPQTPPEVWYGNWRPPVFSFAPLEVAPPPSSSTGLLWKIPVALALLAAIVLALLTQYAAKSPVPATLSSKMATPSAATMTPTTPVSTQTSPLPIIQQPLHVTLRSDSAQDALSVGKPVTISVAASLPHDHSATLTVFYRHDSGAKQMLVQAQGSLCRAAWTPSQPGLYEFTATALDDRRRVAAAPMLILYVATPPRVPGALIPVQSDAVLPPAALLGPVPKRHIAKKLIAKHLAVSPKFSPKTAAMQKLEAKRVTPFSSLSSSPYPTRFHVAAAQFPYVRNAVVLANALRTRGFMAVVRKGKIRHGQPAYVVQTGVFPSTLAAHQQALRLQRDGYPAFIYADH